LSSGRLHSRFPAAFSSFLIFVFSVTKFTP
jgi:hypothetical protein